VIEMEIENIEIVDFVKCTKQLDATTDGELDINLCGKVPYGIGTIYCEKCDKNKVYVIDGEIHYLCRR